MISIRLKTYHRIHYNGINNPNKQVTIDGIGNYAKIDMICIGCLPDKTNYNKNEK